MIEPLRDDCAERHSAFRLTWSRRLGGESALLRKTLPLSADRKYPIIRAMTNEWIVEFTDEFELWWLELSELVQENVPPLSIC